MDLSTLVKMSNTYGSNPAYVLAGGGNTSVKDDTTLYVKGSGTQLATIKAEGFVKMDRARLNEIMKTEYPANDVERESAYLADVMAAVTDDDKTKRPSVEALLHNLFAYTYVLHVHPTLVNGLTCGKGALRGTSGQRCSLDRYLQTGIYTCTHLLRENERLQRRNRKGCSGSSASESRHFCCGRYCGGDWRFI